MAKDINKNFSNDEILGDENFDFEPWEKKLKGVLHRFDCPSPLELGEYTLKSQTNTMSQEQIMAIEDHLNSCDLCRDELEAIKSLKARGFLSKPEPVEPEKSRIIPFRQEVTYYEDDAAGMEIHAAFRGENDTKSSSSTKVSIKIDEKQSLDMYYRLTEEESNYIIYGQFLPEDMMADKLEGCQLEIWQEKEICGFEKIDELLAFHCKIRHLAPLSIRVSSKDGTWLAFNIELNR